MTPRSISILAAAVITLGGAVAIANPTNLLPHSIAQAPAKAQHEGGPGWLKDLNLTSDQVQKIQAIRKQYKDQLTQQRQAARQGQQELRELMAGTASADQVKQKYTQVQGLQQQLADTQFNSILAMRDVLNPDQRRRFAEQMKKQRDNFRNRPGKQMRPQSDSGSL